jgi:hypothetical protein
MEYGIVPELRIWCSACALKVHPQGHREWLRCHRDGGLNNLDAKIYKVVTRILDESLRVEKKALTKLKQEGATVSVGIPRCDSIANVIFEPRTC